MTLYNKVAFRKVGKVHARTIVLMNYQKKLLCVHNMCHTLVGDKSNEIISYLAFVNIKTSK